MSTIPNIRYCQCGRSYKHGAIQCDRCTDTEPLDPRSIPDLSNRSLLAKLPERCEPRPKWGQNRETRLSSPTPSFSLLSNSSGDPVGRLARTKVPDLAVLSKCRLDQYDCQAGIVLMEARPYNVTACEEDIDGLLDAIRHFREKEICKNLISILVQDPARPRIARCRQLDLESIHDLLSRIRDHIKGLYDHLSLPESKILRTETVKLCVQIEQELLEIDATEVEDIPRLENWEISDLDCTLIGQSGPHAETFLFWCRRFHSTLALILSSYSGSHISPFDEVIHGRFIDTYIISNNFALRRKSLASLDEFLNGSAWIFGEYGDDQNSLSLSIGVQGFCDLWGPLESQPAENGLGFIRLHTEGGFIQLLNSSPHQLSGDETACYWCPSSYPTDRTSQAPHRGESSSSPVRFDFILPEYATLLICQNPDSSHEETEQLCATAFPTSSREAETQTERDQDQPRMETKQNIIENSKNSKESPNADPWDDLKPSTLICQKEPDLGKCDGSGEEDMSFRNIDDSPSTESDVSGIEEVNLFSIWSKVKLEVVERLIRNHKPMLMQVLGVVMHGGEGQTQQGGAVDTSMNGEGSETNSSRRSQKRQYEDDNTGPPNDNQGRKRSGPRSSSSGSPDRSYRRVACHFYVRNPERYQNERACTGPGFLTIDKLKEHLERRHERPHQCPRCWIIFPCEQSLLEHLQADPICERIDPKSQKDHEAEGLTLAQRKAIRSKSHFVNAQTLEEQWNVVWRILFPNDFPIPSPYFIHSRFEHSKTFIKAEQIRLVRERLTQFMRSELESYLPSIPEPIRHKLENRMATITEECYEEAVKTYSTMHLSINQPLESDNDNDNKAEHSSPSWVHQGDISLMHTPNGILQNVFGQEAGDEAADPVDHMVAGGIVSNTDLPLQLLHTDSSHDNINTEPPSCLDAHQSLSFDAHRSPSKQAPLSPKRSTETSTADYWTYSNLNFEQGILNNGNWQAEPVINVTSFVECGFAAQSPRPDQSIPDLLNYEENESNSASIWTDIYQVFDLESLYKDF